MIPQIALLPHRDRGLEEAVERGGGDVAEPDRADALVWTDPFDPEGLRAVLAGSTIRWVQLPFAGIERFLEAGVVDPALTWTCAKGVYGHSTAEHALALMLTAARRLHRHARATTWEPAPDGVAEKSLAGAVVVVIGTGGIGTALTRLLRPLRARVIAVNRSGRDLEGAERTVTTSELSEVVALADFVVVAAALTAETRNLVNGRVLEAMKKDAWLVNVARGGLVDHEDLVTALRAGRIGGAALDVTEPEPLPPGHSLWGFDDVLITPHMANTWTMAVPELRNMVERNVRLFARGDRLEGLVDPALGY